MELKKSKKGVVESQINWVFILIVGGVILLFFIMFVTNQKKSSDITISSDVLNHLDSITKGAAISIGTLYDITMPPKQAFENKCLENSFTLYGSSLQGLNLEYTVLFSPRLIDGEKIFTYSLYFKAPYVVGSFLYMVTDGTLFFVLDEKKGFDFQINELYDELPVKNEENFAELKAVLYRDEIEAILETVDFDNYLNIKIIGFDIDEIDDFVNLIKEKSNRKTIFSVYDIKSQNGKVNFNDIISVDYYKIKDKNIDEDGTRVNTIKFPGLLGLILSDDVSSYECNMRKAFKRFDMLNKLYKVKTENIQNYISNYRRDKNTCLNYYELSIFDNINVTINKILNNGDIDLSFVNVKELMTSADQLDNLNGNLGDMSCPIPY